MQGVDSCPHALICILGVAFLFFLVVCLLCQRDFVPCAHAGTDQGKRTLDRLPSRSTLSGRFAGLFGPTRKVISVFG